MILLFPHVDRSSKAHDLLKLSKNRFETNAVERDTSLSNQCASQSMHQIYPQANGGTFAHNIEGLICIFGTAPKSRSANPINCDKYVKCDAVTK